MVLPRKHAIKHRIRISVAVGEVSEAVNLMLMRTVHLDHLCVLYVKDCQDALSDDCVASHVTLSKNDKSRPVIGGPAGVARSRIRVKPSQKFWVGHQKVGL